MKNRRNVIVAFLLVAVMCMGVGFAQLNDTLTVKGTVSVSAAAMSSEFEANVHWQNEQSTISGVTLAFTDSNDTVSVDIDDSVLVAKGDYVEVTLTIVNESPYYAKITPNEISLPTNAVYSVTHDHENDGGCTINPSSTKTVTLKVTLDDVVDSDYSDVTANTSFTFSFTAVAVEADGTEV